jgi:hypothetical protein
MAMNAHPLRRVLRAATQRMRSTAIIGACLGAALVVSACGSPAPRPVASPAPRPVAAPAPQLSALMAPGNSVCVFFRGPANGVTGWQAPVAFAMDLYVNHGSTPATILSLSLVDPHGLVLHDGVVYEVTPGGNMLGYFGAWGRMYATAARARQPIPGAVLQSDPVAHPPYYTNDTKYQILEKVTATSASGGWAAGVTVNYESGGRHYSTTAAQGIAIGSSHLPASARCTSPLAAIKADFKRRGTQPYLTLSGYVV